MKKLMSILLLMSFGLFILNVKAQENVGTIGHAIISVNEDLPIFFVKGNETLKGDLAIAHFKQYFSLRDQRQDVEVLDEYLDIGTFDIDVVGEYDIILRFTGKSTLEVSETLTVYVIEADTLPPMIYGFRENITYNVAKKEDQDKVTLDEKINAFIKSLNLTVKDNVDGLIPLTKEHFTGVSEIDPTNLNGEYEITLTVSDQAGNELTRSAVVQIKDISGPVIFNPHNISTRRNKVVEFKDHVIIEDNYNEREDLEVWYTIAFLTYKMVDGKQTTVLTPVDDVDFSKLGEFVITVHAKDKSDNLAATKQYKVIIEDGIPLSTVVILVNASLLILAGAVTITLVIVHKKKQKGETNEIH